MEDWFSSSSLSWSSENAAAQSAQENHGNAFAWDNNELLLHNQQRQQHQEQQQEWKEWLPWWSSRPLEAASRALAGGSSTVARIDYAVLACAIMTLGLILVVEVGRHKLDHFAIGRPFFKAVLTGVYSELSTLGMVEAVIFILHNHWKDMNLDKERVFAQVHFTLFYTAMINAVQSVLLAIFASRVSHKIWIQTEALELDHYVEIREDFQRVQQELEKLAGPMFAGASVVSSQQAQQIPTSIRGSTATLESTTTQQTTTGEWSSLGATLRACWYRIRYPRLVARYNELVVQVRFHELRVHFLQAYKLPLKLQISDYLIRSEQHVLIGLVSVSSVAWLLFTGGLNVLYFSLGMVAYETHDGEVVGSIVQHIYFIIMALFIVIAIAVYYKMVAIFAAIMHQKVLWEDAGQLLDEKRRKQLARKQLDLFWGGDPKLVVSAVQFMQFGYAILLSTILIFWDTVKESDTIPMSLYLIVLFACYAIFLMVCAEVIPRYTLCTSLGQLVDMNRLHETVAAFRLKEAKRNKQKLEVAAAHQAMLQAGNNSSLVERDMSKSYTPQAGNTVTTTGSVSTSTSEFGGPPLGGSVVIKGLKRLLTASAGNSTCNSSNNSIASAGAGAIELERPVLAKGTSVEMALLMAELVKLDTKELRTNIPERDREALLAREQARALRHANRKKSISEGVAAMKVGLSSSWTIGTRSAISSSAGRSQDDSYLQSSSGGSVSSMNSSGSFKRNRSDGRGLNARTSLSRLSAVGEGDEVSIFSSGSSVAIEPPEALSPLDTQPERLMERKRKSHRRLKTRSDGVAAMAMMGSSTDDLFFSPLPSSLDDDDNNKKVGGADMENEPANDTLQLKSPPSNGKNLVSPSVVKEDKNNDESHEDVDSPSRPMDNKDGPQTQTIVDNIPQDLTTPARDRRKADDEQDSLSDDGHSDANDVPQVDPDVVQQKNEELVPPEATLREQLFQYYTSSRYVLYSNVFGTMVAFFFVGQRVERFLDTEGVISSEFVAFDFDNKLSFWTLMIWLSFFMVNDMLLFYSVGPYKRVANNKQRGIILAAVLDYFLSLACLLIFVMAEVARCCESDYGENNDSEFYPSNDANKVGKRASDKQANDHRTLAGDAEYPVADKTYGSGVYNPKYSDPAPCSCPSFGSRTYGGLGSLEPFVAIIGLRIFRHWLAKALVKWLDRHGRLSQKDEDADSRHRRSRLNILSIFVGDHGMHSARNEHVHHYEEERGTVAELWQAAVSRHPDIVEKHGEFSGELLQAMLGIAVESSNGSSHHSDRSILAKSSSSLLVPALSNTVCEVDEPIPRKSYALTKEYSNLSVHAQQLIMAGKLGCSVRAICVGSKALGPPETIFEGSPSAGPRECIFFEKDPVQNEPSEWDHDLVDPNALLVRSMRRCDRKLLPLFHNWSPVDVVVTRFEMVYFDVSDADDPDHTAAANALEALEATKGGKGLRLCDVAKGRKIVGHLQLSDVISVYVEREMPDETADDEEYVGDEIEKNEFWLSKRDLMRNPRSKAWNRIKQDRIKIQTINGRTFYLRFYADLEEAEKHPERMANDNEETGDIYKNNAIQWVQTIIRLCGPDQLKQLLPHFGSETSDELRDFLIVRKRDGDSKNGLLSAMISKRNFHRSSSITETSGNALGGNPLSSPIVVGDSIRSIDDLKVGSSTRKNENRGRHRRAQSALDISTLRDLPGLRRLRERTFSNGGEVASAIPEDHIL